MIIDVITIALLLIIGIVNYFGGFLNGCLKNILTVASIAVMIIVAPILVGVISPMFAGIGESIGYIGEFNAGALAVTIISYLIVCIVLALVLWLLCFIIRKIILKILKPVGFWKIINRLAGLVCSIAIYGVLFMAIYALLVQIPVEGIQNVFASSIIMQNNFLVEPLSGIINFGATASIL